MWISSCCIVSVEISMIGFNLYFISDFEPGRGRLDYGMALAGIPRALEILPASGCRREAISRSLFQKREFLFLFFFFFSFTYKLTIIRERALFRSGLEICVSNGGCDRICCRDSEFLFLSFSLRKPRTSVLKYISSKIYK